MNIPIPFPIFETTVINIPFFWIFYIIMAVLTFIASYWIIRIYDKEKLTDSLWLAFMFGVIWPISLFLLLAMEVSNSEDRKKEIKKLKKKVKK